MKSLVAKKRKTALVSLNRSVAYSTYRTMFVFHRALVKASSAAECLLWGTASHKGVDSIR